MTSQKDWYKTWFNSPYYHILYKHRDFSEARSFIDKLVAYLCPSANAKMLDLACGKGRHSLYLCKKGFEVTGVDLSEENIKAAKEITCYDLYFEVYDMRKPVKEDYFDYVFNFFTSFGYFDSEEDNQRTINAISTALVSGGHCVIDFLNAEKVINQLSGHEQVERDGIVFNINRRYEDGFIIKEINFEADGEQHRFLEKVQALCLGDFKRLFSNSKLKLIDTFGNYDLEPFDADKSDRLILVAKKSG